MTSSFITDLMINDDRNNPDKFVYFKIGDNPILKVYLKALVEESSDFKQDTDHKDLAKPYPVDDQIPNFDTFEVFKTFISCLYDDRLGLVSEFEQVYHFAKKFKCSKLMVKCKNMASDHLTVAIEQPTAPRVKQLHEMLLAMDVGDDGTINKLKTCKLTLDKDSYLEAYRILQKLGMEVQKKQVIEFCIENIELKKDWPENLKDDVLESLVATKTPGDKNTPGRPKRKKTKKVKGDDVDADDPDYTE